MSGDLAAKSSENILLDGELDFATVPAWWQKIEQRLQAKQRLCLDLAQVQRANSAGLALLLEVWAKAEAMDIAFAAKNVPQSIHELAAMSGFSELPFPTE